MKKINKILRTSIIALILVLLMQITVFADTLNINIKANNAKIKVGDKVKVTVYWDKGMQAADYILNYDSEKLEFVKTDLKDDYINNTNGQVKTAWFSVDDKDKTKIEYTFKAKKSGTAELKTTVNGGFATGNLEMPTEYTEGELQLNISKANVSLKILKILAIVIVILVLINLIFKRLQKSGKIYRRAKFK